MRRFQRHELGVCARDMEQKSRKFSQEVRERGQKVWLVEINPKQQPRWIVPGTYVGTLLASLLCFLLKLAWNVALCQTMHCMLINVLSLYFFLALPHTHTFLLLLYSLILRTFSWRFGMAVNPANPVNPVKVHLNNEFTVHYSDGQWVFCCSFYQNFTNCLFSVSLLYSKIVFQKCPQWPRAVDRYHQFNTQNPQISAVFDWFISKYDWIWILLFRKTIIFGCFRKEREQISKRNDQTWALTGRKTIDKSGRKQWTRELKKGPCPKERKQKRKRKKAKKAEKE